MPEFVSLGIFDDFTLSVINYQRWSIQNVNWALNNTTFSFTSIYCIIRHIHTPTRLGWGSPQRISLFLVHEYIQYRILGSKFCACFCRFIKYSRIWKTWNSPFSLQFHEESTCIRVVMHEIFAWKCEIANRKKVRALLKRYSNFVLVTVSTSKKNSYFRRWDWDFDDWLCVHIYSVSRSEMYLHISYRTYSSLTVTRAPQ